MLANPSTHTSQPSFWMKRDIADALFHLTVSALLLILSVACFLVSIIFGAAMTCLMTLGLCIMLPNAAPVLLVSSFMYQSMLIAIFGPMVPSSEAFDALRGINFIVLMTLCGTFFLAVFLNSTRLPHQVMPWVIGLLAVVGVVVVYFGLGAIQGEPRDAIVYFRNTITPLGCFGVGLIAATLYRVELRRALTWLGFAGLFYGYCELFFTIDFLALFNGEEYIARRLVQQIESGHWERVLAQTGFVLRGLEDIMTVPFLNMSIFEGIVPNVFRLSGPNFHPISFAYALAITAVWLMYLGRPLFLVLALPVLLVVGSKGSLLLIFFALSLKIGIRLVGVNLATVIFFSLLGTYITAAILYGQANGDYHVLGFIAGIREFVSNPVGEGLGLGGNLSSSIKDTLNWSRAQHQGFTDIPVESAIGVMLYQMGVGSAAFFGLLFFIIRTCYKLFMKTNNPNFLFGLATISTISTNAFLQEEAFYSPLALGYCLIIVAVALGSHLRQENRAVAAIVNEAIYERYG